MSVTPAPLRKMTLADEIVIVLRYAAEYYYPSIESLKSIGLIADDKDCENLCKRVDAIKKEYQENRRNGFALASHNARTNCVNDILKTVKEKLVKQLQARS